MWGATNGYGPGGYSFQQNYYSGHSQNAQRPQYNSGGHYYSSTEPTRRQDGQRGLYNSYSGLRTADQVRRLSQGSDQQDSSANVRTAGSFSGVPLRTYGSFSSPQYAGLYAPQTEAVVSQPAETYSETAYTQEYTTPVQTVEQPQESAPAQQKGHHTNNNQNIYGYYYGPSNQNTYNNSYGTYQRQSSMLSSNGVQDHNHSYYGGLQRSTSFGNTSGYGSLYGNGAGFGGYSGSAYGMQPQGSLYGGGGYGNYGNGQLQQYGSMVRTQSITGLDSEFFETSGNAMSRQYSFNSNPTENNASTDIYHRSASAEQSVEGDTTSSTGTTPTVTPAEEPLGVSTETASFSQSEAQQTSPARTTHTEKAPRILEAQKISTAKPESRPRIFKRRSATASRSSSQQTALAPMPESSALFRSGIEGGVYAKVSQPRPAMQNPHYGGTMTTIGRQRAGGGGLTFSGEAVI